MKVKFDIECTPEEARRFMGLPDVQPMQQAMMKELENKMRENMNAMDPEAMMKTWMPGAIQNWGQNWEEMQRMFWQQMNMTASKAEEEK